MAEKGGILRRTTLSGLCNEGGNCQNCQQRSVAGCKQDVGEHDRTSAGRMEMPVQAMLAGAQWPVTSDQCLPAPHRCTNRIHLKGAMHALPPQTSANHRLSGTVKRWQIAL